MENTNKWSSAAYNGLLLSLVTVIITLLTSAFDFQNIILSILLWALKLVGSIWILYYFMKQYSADTDKISYKESFKYGTIICFFSSIICAGISYLSMTLIFPESMDKVTEAVNKAIAQQNMTSEQEGAIMGILPKIPEISLVFGFIYYMIFGVIVSSIIANYTKKDNPFANDSQETLKDVEE